MDSRTDALPPIHRDNEEVKIKDTSKLSTEKPSSLIRNALIQKLNYQMQSHEDKKLTIRIEGIISRLKRLKQFSYSIFN